MALESWRNLASGSREHLSKGQIRGPLGSTCAWTRRQMPRAVSMSSMGTGLGGAEWLLPVASGRSVGSSVVDWRRGQRLLLLPSKPLLPWSLEHVEELDTARGIEDMKFEKLSPHCSLRKGASDMSTCA